MTRLEAWSPRGVLVPRPMLLVALTSISSCIVMILLTLHRPEEWVGWLPSSISVSESAAACWPACIGSSVGSFLASRARRYGVLPWSSAAPRPMGEQARPVLLWSFLGVLLGYLAAVLGMSWRSLSAELLPDGWSSPELLLSIPTVASYLLVWVAMAVWLGRLANPTLALPVAIFAPFSWYAGMAYFAGDGPLGSLAVGDGRVFDYVKPGAGVLVTRFFFWTALALCLCMGALGRTGTFRRTAWIVSGLAGAALLQGPAYVAIGGSGNGICRGVEPVTCLDGAHAALMTRYRTEIARIVEALPENLRPSYWSSDPRFVKHGGDTILAPPVAGYMYPAHTIDAAMFVARVGDALFVGPCISSGRGSDTAMTLVAWWRLSHGINPSTAAYPGDTNFPPAWDAGFDRRMSRAREFAALSRADRDAWLSAHASEIRTCRAPEPGL